MSEHDFKKRASERQITRDDPDHQGEEEEQNESGETWKEANPNVLAARKIVKVRRRNAPLEPVAHEPETNGSSGKKEEKAEEKKEEKAEEKKEEKKEGEEKKEEQKEGEKKEEKKEEQKDGEKKEEKKEGDEKKDSTSSPFSSKSPFAFSFTPGSSPFAATSSSPFNFSFNPGNTPIFGYNINAPSSTSTPSTTKESEEAVAPLEETADDIKKTKIISLTPQAVVTGEEDEEQKFCVRAKLFALDKGEGKWKERGVGQLRINLSKETKKARLVMRTDASLKVILNAIIYSAMPCDKRDDKSLVIVAVEETPVNILMKVGKKEEAEELFNLIEKYKREAKQIEASEPKEKATSTTTTTTTTTTTSHKSEQNGEKKEETTESK